MPAANRRNSHRAKTTKASTATRRSRSRQPGVDGAAVQWIQVGVVAATLGGAAVALGHGIASAASDEFSLPAGTRHASIDHSRATAANATDFGPGVAPHAIRIASAEPSTSDIADRGADSEHHSTPASSKQIHVFKPDPSNLSPNALLAKVTLPDPVPPQSISRVVISSPVAAVFSLQSATTTPPAGFAGGEAAWGLISAVGSPFNRRRPIAVPAATQLPVTTTAGFRPTGTDGTAVAATGKDLAAGTGAFAAASAAWSGGTTEYADSTPDMTAKRKAAQAETNALVGWLPVSSTELNGLDFVNDFKDFTGAVVNEDAARMRADIGYMAMDAIGLIPYVGPSLEANVYQAALHTVIPTYPVPVADNPSTVSSSTETSDLFAAMDAATPDKVTAQLVVGSDGTKRMIVSMSGAQESSPGDVLSGSVAEGVQGDNGWLNPVVSDFIGQAVSKWQPSEIMLVGFSNGGQQMENYAATGTYRDLVTNLVLFGAPITQNANAIPGVDSVDIVDSGDKATLLLQYFEHYGNYDKTTTDNYAIFTTSAGPNSSHSQTTYQQDAQNFDNFAEGQLNTNSNTDYVRIWNSMQRFVGTPSQSLSITTTSSV